MEPMPPISRFFNHPLLCLLLHVLTPLVTCGILAYLSWLCVEDFTRASAILFMQIGLLELATAVGGGWSLLRKGSRMAMQGWAIGLNGLALTLLFIYLFYFDSGSRFDAMLPVWMDLNLPILMVIIFSHLALLQCAIAALCARPFATFSSPLKDFGATFCTGLLLVFGGLLVAQMRLVDLLSNNVVLWGGLLFALVSVTVVLHALGLLACLHQALKQRYKYYAFGLRLVFIGVLPTVALIANRTVPIPFNLQTPWCYGLIALFSLVMLLPSTRITVWLRWMLLPFTCYFFLIFLPVLPFIVLLIFACGVGFLFFIPLLIFCQHLQSLREVKLPKLAIVAALLVIPLGFILITERDRVRTRALIEHLATPDMTTGRDELPMPEEDARIAAHTIYQSECGDRMPFLSVWRDYRLFDGLHPRQETIDTLVARFGRPKVWGLLRQPNRRRWAPSVPFHAELPAEVTFVQKDPRTVTACITIQAEPWREFRRPIRLAYGTWITGLRLQMPDGSWKNGTFRDRRAATWIYEQTVQRSRDPALLTLDSPTRGTLRVFPLETVRHVEIDLLMPQANWADVPFVFEMPGDPQEELAVHAPIDDPRKPVKVCFVEGGATSVPEGYDLYVTCAGEIRVQTVPPPPPPAQDDYDVKRAIRFAQGYAYAHALRIAEVGYVGSRDFKGMYADAIEPPRPTLPMLPPDDPWQIGAQMWQLAEAMHHNQKLDYRAELRELAQRCGVLTPTNAYVALETLRQERELAAAEFGIKNAHLAFDVNPVDDAAIAQDAPGAILLALLFCLLLTLLRYKPARIK